MKPVNMEAVTETSRSSIRHVCKLRRVKPPAPPAPRTARHSGSSSGKSRGGQDHVVSSSEHFPDDSSFLFLDQRHARKNGIFMCDNYVFFPFSCLSGLMHVVEETGGVSECVFKGTMRTCSDVIFSFSFTMSMVGKLY
ncbi:hypothetical protein F7725_007177 [Dissostichus mawsoni]|uniref:Uncharacterized protein n=1 Tax=Dissostichus mawsoni TaxID=36200 RepID=A0A7J5XW30_DISMA|nr:hypothetical protein F7725_007177 [Dissostichus mawsoni]